MSRRRKKPKPGSFEIIDDGAGLRIRIQAANWRELLRAAASGMFSLWPQERPATHTATRMIPVELEATDYATLLLDWLNELASLSQAESMVFCGSEVLQLDFEATCRLTAMVEGCRTETAPTRFKALTSSGRTIEESSGGLTAEITFEACDVR